jgi:GT2 family glycosyltransferase
MTAEDAGDADRRQRMVALAARLGRLSLKGAPAPSAQAIPAADAASAEALRLPAALHPDVSIIIPSYGQVGVTLRCLAAIAAAPPRATIEVLVAEDASGDPDVPLLEKVAGLRLLRRSVNLGFLGNCNAAASAARGRDLLFLNNDTEVLPGAIDALVGTLRDWPEAGLVGAKLVFADGRLQEAGGIVWDDGATWNWGRGGDPDAPEFNYLRPVDYCSGAAILVRGGLFAALGGFDARYAPAYYEDTDLAFRIRGCGFDVLYQPEAVVLHHEGLSYGTDTARSVTALLPVNRGRFLCRWQDVLRRDHRPVGTGLLRARDRAMCRSIVLVVTDNLPEMRPDAGALGHLLTMLRWAGCLVKIRAATGPDPTSRRHSLQQAGIEVIPGPDAAFTHWLERYGTELDRVMLDGPEIAARYRASLRCHAGQAAVGRVTEVIPAAWP